MRQPSSRHPNPAIEVLTASRSPDAFCVSTRGAPGG
jgi:hypothetical protein